MVVEQLFRGGFGLAVAVALAGCGQTAHEKPYVFPMPPANGGAGGSSAGSASAGMAGDASSAGASGSAPVVVGGAGSGGPAMPSDGMTAWPSAGCGREAAQALEMFVKYVIPTSGTKAADATGVPGPWTYEREFYVWLPPGYDPMKPYGLAVELPGCGANGSAVYPLPMASEPLIRVGLTPPPNDIEHGLAPNQQCFDDYEGDDSVDFAFFEAVLSQLNARFCYNRRRVLVIGNGSGADLANQLACHYAGNQHGYAVLGSITANGGLSSAAQQGLTCSAAPVVGMWAGAVGSTVYPFEETTNAVNRAMQVNGCTAADYDSADLESFPLPNASNEACKRITGCSAPHPLVVCAVPGATNRSTFDDIIASGTSELLKLLAP